MRTKKDWYEMAKAISEYCDSCRWCEGCVFLNDRFEGCSLDGEPVSWELRDLEAQIGKATNEAH